MLQGRLDEKEMFKDKLISNDKIVKGKRIGNGQFGEVYKGRSTSTLLNIGFYKQALKLL